MVRTLKDKFKDLNDYIKNEINSTPSIWLRLKVTLDFLWEKIVLDNELIDYIQYRFYYKKRVERNKFITHSKLLRIMNICNNPAKRKIFDLKPLFNKNFKEYLGRNFLNSKEVSIKEIEKFLLRYKRVFAKSPNGMFGKGIEIIDIKNVEIDERYLLNIKQKGYLLEEVLTQYEDLKEFNESTLNTIRIVTLVTSTNDVKIMASVLRLGRKGKIADNFHHGGIASLIDIDTGIVYTEGIDSKWNKYILHPDSKKKIVGFVIPKWEQIKTVVKNAARIHPDVRYVGWDVAIVEDASIVLIEGNPGADPDVTQIPDQIGKWPLYKPLLDQIKTIS